MADNPALDRITVAIPSTQNVKNATDHFTVSATYNEHQYNIITFLWIDRIKIGSFLPEYSF
jgi:hypothetical protein